MKLRNACACTLALVLGGLSTAHADSLTVELIYQFSGNRNGDFGTVTVTETGGDLQFTITAGPDLGQNMDLQEFYFNLVGSFTGLTVSSTDPQAGRAYRFGMPATVIGNGNFSFDADVNFGNGSDSSGNGVLPVATFILSAVEDLTLAAIMETSNGTTVPVPVLFAARFQGTSEGGMGGITVGAPVPLPGAVWLMGSALLGFPLLRRRRVTARSL